MSYRRLPCECCGIPISTCGGARHSHMKMHAREGKVKLTVDPLLDRYIYKVIESAVVHAGSHGAPKAMCGAFKGVRTNAFHYVTCPDCKDSLEVLTRALRERIEK